MSRSFRYPLSLQTTLPDDYASNRKFASLLTLMGGLGFWGIELNIEDPRRHSFDAIRSFLAGHDLELSMLATGLAAKKLGLSLSHEDDEVRTRSIDVCKELIEWVDSPLTGLIVGFLKGGPAVSPATARDNVATGGAGGRAAAADLVKSALARFEESIREILPHAEERGVAVLIEATNRYESAVANSIDEAVATVSGFPPAVGQVLPDTFHMNIEESNIFEALRKHRSRFQSLHLSDNTRRFPGLGGFDFARFITFLREIGYDGRLAIEGDIRDDIQSDLRASVAHLAPLLASEEAGHE